MKIHGLPAEVLTLPTGTLRFERGTGAIELKLQALPYGFDTELNAALPLPDAEGRAARDPVPVGEEPGPGCKQAIARVNRLRGIYTIAKGLEADPNVAFDAGRSEAAQPWCEAIEQELKDAGFSAGEVSQMLRFVLELSGLPTWGTTPVLYPRFPQALARGGWVAPGPGTDTVPALLTPGEFVVHRAAAQKHAALLNAVNSGRDVPSNISVHITTPLDRHTIRSVVIPEIERARSRGRI